MADAEYAGGGGDAEAAIGGGAGMNVGASTGWGGGVTCACGAADPGAGAGVDPNAGVVLPLVGGPDDPPVCCCCGTLPDEPCFLGPAGPGGLSLGPLTLFAAGGTFSITGGRGIIFLGGTGINVDGLVSIDEARFGSSS